MADLAARIAMTDVRAWPAPVAELALSMPWLSVPVTRTAGGLRALGEVPKVAPLDLMPKLGPKSWQETGRLRIVREGRPLAPAIAGLLSTPTRQQMTVIAAGWPEAGQTEDDEEDQPPLHLHLFEALDFAELSECRCLYAAGRMTVTSHCLRSRVKVRTEAMEAACAVIAETMPGLGPFIAQFVMLPWRNPALIDLNPGLGAADLAALEALTQPAA